MGGDETVAYSGFGAQGVGGVHAHYRWECCKLAHRERLHVFPIHLWVNPLCQSLLALTSSGLDATSHVCLL